LTAVVSLLEDHEIRELELGEEAQISMRAGLSFERFPIADRGVPASPEAALRLCDGIATKIANGLPDTDEQRTWLNKTFAHQNKHKSGTYRSILL
jgi:hypothetical protein